ncbi:uracil-DNA glycosylase family protein [Rhodanobacter thiooxydans]|nr:uracil-DNA glycosylase family protein [Rhodanobacter thiooxydans]MCW0202856.1 hypothetical protein [Rhodanobacter thiooxydans]
MNTYIERFRSIVLDNPRLDPHDDRLVVERTNRIACHYAPFEYVNRDAKVVLLGITPGAQQAGNALNALRTALQGGANDALALQRAKQSASFSGPMRSNLVAMLDRIGMQRTLNIETCARLFDSRTDLAHFTSALRYPVFLDGKDYSGSPSILATPILRSMTQRWLSQEIAQLRDAFWVPLGKESAAVLADFVSRGELKVDHVLAGMPHPSGANAERIAYFLGTKKREDLSAKTNPMLLDDARERLTRSVTLRGSSSSAIETMRPSSIPAGSSAPISNTRRALPTGQATKRDGGFNFEVQHPQR